MTSQVKKTIVFLTGAGISADSGIRTFRDSNGLWENHRIEDVATPEAYAKNPQLVWKFYSMRRLEINKTHPNAAHEAIVKLAENEKFDVHLITQNVDGLHAKADPIQRVDLMCMHGSLNQSRCTQCETVYYDDFAYFDEKGNYAPQETNICTVSQKASAQYLHHYNLEYRNFLPISPCCKEPLRPHIVWFGEIPLMLERIMPLLAKTKLFITIGTSGVVYPAAGFLEVAKNYGAKTICINLETIPQSHSIDEFIQGKAATEVPKFIDELIKSY